MFKVVLDTNVLISASIGKGNEYELLRLGKEGKIKIILSEEILWEFEEVLKRSKFGFSKKQVEDAIEEIKSLCQIVDSKNRIEIVKEDPDDNKIIECAIEGKVDYLISGDNHLLKLKQYENIKIVNATEFLKVLAEK